MKDILNSILSLATKNSAETKLTQNLTWLNELAQVDDIQRLNISSTHINRIHQDATLSTVEKTSLLSSIAEVNLRSANEQVKYFSKLDYVKADVAKQVIESNYNYHRSLFLALDSLIKSIFTDKKNQKSNRLSKIILIMRALIAAIHMLQWRFFEYSSAPANIYLDASALYQLASSEQLHKLESQPYKIWPNTTIHNLLLHLFILGHLNFNDISKLTIENISKLLTLWTAGIETSTELESQHTFFINLNQDQAAQRLRKNSAKAKGLYWDMDNIEAKIEETILAMDIKNPDLILNALDIENADSFNQTLLFLKQEWSRIGYNRERRLEARSKVKKQAQVNVGIQSVCELLSQISLNTATTKSLIDDDLLELKRRRPNLVMRGYTNTLIVGKEKWTITDESSKGLGTLTSDHYQSQIALHILVSILVSKPQATPIIGAVRNITRTTNDELKIGLEIISQQPKVATLKRYILAKESDATAPKKQEKLFESPQFTAIYIPIDSEQDLADNLIMPKVEYMANALYEITFNKKKQMIKLGQLLESGDDWIQVRFSAPDL
jgi:hypothetical protein